MPETSDQRIVRMLKEAALETAPHNPNATLYGIAAARLADILDTDPVAWAIEVNVQPKGAEPYDAIDDVFLDPAGAHSMAMRYTAGANPRVIPLHRLNWRRDVPPLQGPHRGTP